MAETPEHADTDRTNDAPSVTLADVAAALASGKGSVGKTTSTVHLGALPTKPVLITDTDGAPRLDDGDRHAQLRSAVERATSQYDLILIDVPPRPDLLPLVDPDDPRRAR
ncbi:hypothetical protein [Micromonospora sp. CPCC 206061]|uniref:hypothetical protein n=1 Tax=Micromonospora sp. CPCC 206061 TaxID=3122410 RepID=UPI002FEED013